MLWKGIDMKRIVNLLVSQERKLRMASIPLIMLLISTPGEASCSKLAKVAGISPNNLQHIIEKLVRIESRTGKYNVKNYRSGAYGRYQIMPKTAAFYSKKLGIPKHLWKKPSNQDRIFQAIIKDNIKSLKRNGHNISAFSIYAIHQQGAHGFNTIMKGRPLTKKIEKNIRRNLPRRLSKVKKSKLRYTWIKYWKKRLS